MSLAYLLAKATAKVFKVRFNLPIVLTLSVIPDVDIVFNFLFGYEIHRGPTHSIILAILIFIPFFVFYRKKASPYFAALISHSLIADFLIGGELQLLWPLSTHEFSLSDLGFPYISIYSSINIALEFTLFVIALVVMLKTRDIFHFFQNNKLISFLSIPIFTILLPTVASYPLRVPIELLIPHIFYLALFAMSFLVVLVELRKEKSIR